MLKLEQLSLKLNFDGKKTTKILFRKLEDSSLVHFFRQYISQQNWPA